MKSRSIISLSAFTSLEALRRWSSMSEQAGEEEGHFIVILDEHVESAALPAE